jgi:hypothetical protein
MQVLLRTYMMGKEGEAEDWNCLESSTSFTCSVGARGEVLLDQQRDVFISFWACCILPNLRLGSQNMTHNPSPLELRKCTLRQFWDFSSN